ncbi:MAG TPA: BON domain-containing protein [Bryobacteraceae bacterium]|nr:BON domain-containing protein [Bryobacteraceae bacterium]
MNTTKTIFWSACLGAALGAGAMYLLDPDRGRRRRSSALERSGSVLRHTGRRAAKFVRDLENRTRGLACSRQPEDGVNDDVLVSRVRSRLGRLAEHPHRVEVTARNGVVTLHGTVRREEYDRLLSDVRGVAGVLRVENRLAEETLTTAR